MLLEKEVPRIESPSKELEQYTTPAELAIAMASVPLMKGVLQDALVADLGAGTCRIALAALLLGAAKAIAVDFDARLGPLCMGAAQRLGLSGRLAYVSSWIRPGPLREGLVDVILMNPPFGVWRRGADREFLEYSMSLSPRMIVALVKSGNLEFHENLAKSMGYSFSFLGTYYFPIPAAMPHHRSRIKRIKVDMIELAGE